MAADILCGKIYSSVAHIKDQAERMDALKEDARKLHRYLKRVEAVVSDLQPYYTQQQTSQAQSQPHEDPDTEAQNESISTAAQVLAGLHGVQAVLSEVQEMLEQACSRGKLSTYLQADRLLQHFQAATADLEAAVCQLPCSPALLGSAHEETSEQLESLQAALHKVKFDLSAEHAQQLDYYRAACDSLQGPLKQLQASCKDILQQVCGHTALTRDEFAAAVADLQQEVRQLQQHQGLQHTISSSSSILAQQPAGSAAESAPGSQQQQQQQSDEFYLRMMCDLLRVNHQQEGVPLEFTCPLTTAIMHDPVILHETGHSYERQAIEDWFASGHRLCPKTGTALGKKLNSSPNHALRAAIRTWSEASDLQLRFRPLLRGSAADSKNLLTPAFGAPHDQDGKPLPAAMTSGQLVNILAGSSSGISPSSSTSTDLDAIEGTAATGSSKAAVALGTSAAGVGGGTGLMYMNEAPDLQMIGVKPMEETNSSDVSAQTGSAAEDKTLVAAEVLQPWLPVSEEVQEDGAAAVGLAGAGEGASSPQ